MAKKESSISPGSLVHSSLNPGHAAKIVKSRDHAFLCVWVV